MTGYRAYIERITDAIIEENCANDGEHTSINKQCVECIQSFYQVHDICFCMVFPFVLH